MRIGQETIEHIKAIDWLKHYHPELSKSVIHIANERKTSIMNGGLLKRMGVKKGVSDLFFPKPNIDYHGLFIEIKSATGKPSPEQRAFIKEVIKDGYYACFAYGAQEVIDVICSYFNLEKGIIS